MKPDDARTLVVQYLDLIQERNLEAAKQHLHPEATIIYPGSRVFASLDDQFLATAQIFRSIRKTFRRIDVIPLRDGAIVYALGHLRGEATDGTNFSRVRFIDRFEILDGRIVSHEVWNDLAAS